MPETDLDRLRSEYVRQIYEAAHGGSEIDEEHRKCLIDFLVLEWGAKAYRQGREHMAARIKRCADEWTAATG